MKKSRINSQKKHTDNEESPSATQIAIVTAVLGFLQLFLPKTIAKRVVCLLLLVGKVRTSLITKLVGISAQTISKIRKAALSDNIESLFTIKSGGGRKNKLQTVEQAIIDMIDTNNYHTLNQIQIMIEEKFGIVTSVSTISRLLKKHGIKRLKSGSFPAKADPVAQRTFYETRLVPLMEDAKSGLIALFSLDASHFVMGGDWLNYVYGKTRRYVTTFSGRMRYNVLGALNLASKMMITVTNDTYITSTQVCELLKTIHSNYVGIPIHIILDNARYQKCKVVQQLADELSITLEYIPAYSPNLNVIERFWKYVKGNLRNINVNNFQQFCDYIDLIVECRDENAKKSLNKLITDKIQFFDDLVPINESTYAVKEPKKMAA